MHLVVAVEAALAAVEGIGGVGKYRISGVTVAGVALQAKLRRLGDQHRLVDAAVGVMTVGAVVGDGRMLPQFRPTFLAVTGIAVVIDAHLLQAGLAQTAVGIVTVATDHLLPLHWVAAALM